MCVKCGIKRVLHLINATFPAGWISFWPLIKQVKKSIEMQLGHLNNLCDALCIVQGREGRKKTADGSISGVYPDLSMIYRVQLCRATDEWNPKGGHSKTRIDSGGYPHSEFQQPNSNPPENIPLAIIMIIIIMMIIITADEWMNE